KDGIWAGSANAPRLAGAPVRVGDYAEAIAEGFTAMYRLLVRERAALLSGDGPLAWFVGDEVRCVLRNTRLYSLLLFHSFHPDMLRDALRRDRFFDHLWAEIPYRPHLARVVAAERADLHNNDIPFFTAQPDSTDLWTSTGQRIAGFFAEPGLAAVRRQVAGLGAADLEQQLRLVRGALTTLTMGEEAALGRPNAPPARRAATTPARLLEAACAVGDRLERVAVQGAADATWMGFTLTPPNQWALAPLDTDLYEGLAGVTLFLAYLGAVSGEARYTALARRAWVTARRQIAARRGHWRAIGGFTGWGGLIYTLAHLDALWGDPGLRAEAAALVELLPPLIARDDQYDLLAGAAGGIAGLLSLYRRQPTARTLEVAVQCGDHLLAAARPQPAGIGWVPAGLGEQPLAGFAHGAAGIACALLDLAATSGEARFADAAAAALAYERTLFVPEAGNWRDLRPGVYSVTQELPVFWCNGAAGIGLGRLRMYDHQPDPAIRAEIAVALETTLAHGFGRTHALCHGDLGNLELLLQAAEVLDEPRWPAATRQQAGLALESIAAHGWLCGLPNQVEAPGLMTGLAGIGYQLLRGAAPAQVPAVLALAPPVAGAGPQ
ncbi:MAG TPA: type 2 lanthipeptide synthetase LanM, partial [Chloroflexia bacterium]|nr:type 2 lanthipeptide synthetase LanM [Chloroflexia bacterium]